ncbi:hypothetical protein P43SY_009769 [Pythium insidiosum]|uniref:Uncharacterized protein n=1 Tax=Pythium insidiosum TaxID=114742 RepID=A0AAD5QDF3_PYTIN|nr:hypothetical protein P43SY_009769 [Pythium insidiosum]
MRRDDVKPTLQLRHQLCAGSGSSGAILCAAYDTRRHHLLTLVGAAAISSSSLSPSSAPPTLRLFSLRREIRSVPLFDDAHPPPPPVQVAPNAEAPSRRSPAVTADAVAATALESASLQYAPALDVFLAVVSAWAAAKDTATPATSAVFSVVVLEPGSLQKLVTFSGPSTHWLRCLAWDDASSRLVLSCKIRPHRPTTRASVRLLSPGGEHHCAIELLAISKRKFQHKPPVGGETDGELPQEATPLRRRQDRVMLCVERVRLPVWHADPLDHLVVSPHVQRIFGVGSVVVATADDSSVAKQSVVVEWRATDQQDASFLLVKRVLQHRDAITALALTPDGAWLVTGHASGALRVWTTDPHADTAWSEGDDEDDDAGQLSVAERHRSAVTAIALEASASTTALFSTEKAGGVVLHCRVVPGADSAALEALGRLDIDPPVATQEKTLANKRQREKSPPPTVVVSVAVPTRSHTERLLVVARRDVIHVAKVQPVVRVVHRTSESLVALRRVLTDDEPHALSVVTLTGTRLQSVTATTWATGAWAEPTQRSLTPPATQRDATISCLHSASSPLEPLLVLGWTTGVVEVFAVADGRRLAMLQDASVNSEITALSTAVLRPSPSGPSTEDSAVHQQPRRAWGGLLKAKIPASSSTRPGSGHWLVVTAGSADGRLASWRLELGRAECQLLLEASARPPVAVHAAHVVGLDGTTDELVSVGAEGMAKVWDRWTLQLHAHTSLAGETRPLSVASSMRVVSLEASNNPSLCPAPGMVVGFDDGTLSCWHVARDGGERRCVALPVAGHHDRRVTAVEPLRIGGFLTASLDMVVILWAASVDDGVHELRYFEMDNPIVDLCVASHRVVLSATAFEVCAFLLDDSPEEAAPAPAFCAPPDPPEPEQQPLTIADDAAPTSEPGVESPPRVPSVISIPSVVAPSTEEPRPTASYSLTPLAGWATDGLNDAPVDRQVLLLYLHQYVQAHGTAGTIAADALVHFLGLHTLPVLGKRPAFAVRKALKDRKLEPNARLDASEACDVLMELQRQAAGPRRGGTAALTASRRLKKKPASSQPRVDPASDRAAVVTYNALGEKSIQWVPKPTPSSPRPSNQQRSSRSDEPSGSPRAKGSNVAPPELPDAALVARLRLSSRFRALWSRGFCWCGDGVPLRVEWRRDHGHGTAAKAEEQPSRCERCGKRTHSVRVVTRGYQPHFSLRLLLGVISEVYDALAPSAMALLQLQGQGQGQDQRPAAEAEAVSVSVSVSVHQALMSVFRQRYGVAEVVEAKLKLLLLSMVHFVRDVDAVAVFGELLGAFAAPQEPEVSAALVALAVGSYAWLFSREMVHNGRAVLETDGDPAAALDPRRARATHWQFVRLEAALFCAQELFVYPVVNPSYLQTVVQFLEDYAQAEATRPTPVAADDDGRQPRRWLEVHRFLRLLVGEWRQQAAAFRSAEHELFGAPTEAHDTPELRDVLARLRLLLSCFVFFDHDRVGVVTAEDFEALLRRLRYVWPNEGVTAEEAASGSRRDDSLTFENAVRAARRRFADAGGGVCYLDFWAMLYVVGLQARVLLKLREVPSFCRDYKLEVSPALRDALVAYMQGTSALLAAAAAAAAPSSSPSKPRGSPKAAPAQRQADRASVLAGGLHDGPFVPLKTLSHAASLQVLRPIEEMNALSIDGAMPATLQRSDSASALEGLAACKQLKLCEGSGEQHAPVVVGVRPTGPRSKPIALLSLSTASPTKEERLAENENVGEEKEEEAEEEEEEEEEIGPSPAECSHAATASSPTTLLNLYFQFPDVSPRETLVPIAARERRRVVARVPSLDAEALAWKDRILRLHLDGESDRERWRLEAERRRVLELQRAEQEREHARAMQQERQRRQLQLQHQHQHQDASLRSTSPSRPAKADPSNSATRLWRATGAEDEDATGSPIGGGSKTIETAEEDAAKRTEESEPAATDSDAVAVRTSPPLRPRRGVDGQKEAAAAASPAEAGPEAETASPESTTPKRRLSIVIHERPPSVVTAPEPSPRPPLKAVKRGAGDDGSSSSSSSSAEPALPPASPPPPPSGEEELRQSPEPDASGDLEPPVHSCAPEPAEAEEFDRQPDPTEAPEGEQEQAVAAPTTAAATVTVESSSEALVASEPAAVGAPVEENPTAASPRPLLPPREEPHTAPAPATTSASLPAPAPSPAASPVVAESRRSSAASAPKADAPASCSPPRPPDAAVSSAAGTGATRHRFKFSTQPTFLQSAAVTRTPFRSTQWNPSDDSDSDEGPRAPAARRNDNDVLDDAFDDSVAADAMPLRLSPSALAEFQRTWGSQRRHSLIQRQRLMPPLLPETIESPGERVDSEAGAPAPEAARTPASTAKAAGPHEDEDERGGLEIAFSPEAARALERKWPSFFATSEDALFSPLKQQLEARASAQRREEETQSRLMRKRQEQQRQDTMRLQRSSSTATVVSGLSSAASKKDAATFRVRRMTRERCLERQQELRAGDSVEATLARAHDTRYFHFRYARGCDSGGRALPLGIVTVKLHVARGDAELFMSTDTKAPCASDYAWRSSDRPVGHGKATADEGQKLVLFPSDLARVLQAADADDQQRVTFYLAVVALEPQTQFSVGVMASGQRGEPSRALRTVDELIARFSQLAHAYESSSAATSKAKAALAATEPRRVARTAAAAAAAAESGQHAGLDALRRRASRRVSSHRLPGVRRRSSGGPNPLASLIEEAAGADGSQEEDDEEDDESDDGGAGSVDDDDDEDDDEEGEGSDEPEDETFQNLLETIGERNSAAESLRHETTFILNGEGDEHEELLQDEELQLAATTEQLFPVRDDTGQKDAELVAMERRRSSALARHAAQLGRGLSPVKEALSGAGRSPSSSRPAPSASLRVARFRPRLAAYSLSALPPKQLASINHLIKAHKR